MEFVVLKCWTRLLSELLSYWLDIVASPQAVITEWSVHEGACTRTHYNGPRPLTHPQVSQTVLIQYLFSPLWNKHFQDPTKSADKSHLLNFPFWADRACKYFKKVSNVLMQFSLKYVIKKTNEDNIVSLLCRWVGLHHFYHCIKWLTNV